MTKLTTEEWIRERLDNCQRIAASKTGQVRDGWLEDAAYFSDTLAKLARADELQAELGRVKDALAFAGAILEEADFRLGYEPGSLGAIEMQEAFDKIGQILEPRHD